MFALVTPHVVDAHTDARAVEEVSKLSEHIENLDSSLDRIAKDYEVRFAEML